MIDAFLLTFIKLEIGPFRPDLDLTFIIDRQLKLDSHDIVDTIIEPYDQSWPGKMCRMTYLTLNDQSLPRKMCRMAYLTSNQRAFVAEVSTPP